MSTLQPGPAVDYVHDHPPIRNPLEQQDQEMTRGQRIADAVASAVGSWPFIIVQSCILFVWIVANVLLAYSYLANKAWDPYPFILLNLVLSFQAAYTGPVVMMSQNRQSEKDRLMAANDFHINVKAELELKLVLDHLANQDRLLLAILDRLPNRDAPEVQAVVAEVEHDLTEVVELMDDVEARG